MQRGFLTGIDGVRVSRLDVAHSAASSRMDLGVYAAPEEPVGAPRARARSGHVSYATASGGVLESMRHRGVSRTVLDEKIGAMGLNGKNPVCHSVCQAGLTQPVTLALTTIVFLLASSITWRSYAAVFAAFSETMEAV